MKYIIVNKHIFYLLCAIEDLTPTKLRVSIDNEDYGVLINELQS